MKDTTHFYKLKDIDFKTRLVPEQVLEIANDYLNKHDANGLIDKNTIIFRSEDDISFDGVWILTIEPCNHYCSKGWNRKRFRRTISGVLPSQSFA